MTVDRRSFLASLAVGPAALCAQTDSPKPYGSGHFGAWIEDESGLPAFRYDCDQTKDPKAVTALAPGLLSATDHVHQVGNDRVVAIVSNYGHVRVRQDEGAPKFLNDYLPEKRQFGGGIGYLTDGAGMLSTHYPGNAAAFERTFGMGYYRKRVSSDRYTVDQVITAPFGDDPVLLSQVTITNKGSAPAKLRWIEYWGCRQYQFSFRAFMEIFAGLGTPVDLRRRFADRFTHQFERVEGGLADRQRFEGYLPAEQAGFDRVVKVLGTTPNPFLGPVKDAAPGATWDDVTPPPTFVVSLDAPADGITTAAKKFFGAGGVSHPSGLESELDGDLTSTGGDSGMLLERRFTLGPGQSRTLYFLYGYVPAGVDRTALIARYRTHPENVLRDTREQWKSKGMRFSAEDQPWIQRETAWNYYYLRSSLTYDDFFREHILSQGAIYQYVMGFQGAARDPLQHALPFLFSDPAIVKDNLRYALKEVRPDGSIPYGIVGHGMIMPALSDNSSDIPMWLLWAASEYVLATRDRAFLDEQIPLLLGTGAREKASVRELLARCYRHQVEHVGVGEHSVMRMLNDDWNDALVIGWASKASKECAEKGESVLNSAMAAFVFDFYARLLAYTGEEAAGPRQKAEEHRKAARAQWTGKWLRRAWLGPTLGWLGESTLWLEPQPWAIIAGVTSPEQSRQLVAALDEGLRRPSPIGAMQIGQGPDTKGATFETGTAVNGGVWPSLNQTLIWALAMVDGKLAWDEWLKNTQARRAEVYPDIWYSAWSGPDTINSVLSKQPGQTVNSGFLHWTDWPVMNLHAHACSMYSLVKLLGLEFTEAGLSLAPVIPLNAYRFESPLFGLIKTAAGYEGWYAPSQPGAWTIALQLPPAEAARFTVAKVNGKRVSGTAIHGDSKPGSPLRWSLTAR